jgi:hypothetical protein
MMDESDFKFIAERLAMARADQLTEGRKVVVDVVALRLARSLRNNYPNFQFDIFMSIALGEEYHGT